jgi:predicted lipoprotein with Yx(FWY)xxD motif
VRKLLALAAAGAVLGLAACGSSDDGNAPDRAAPPTTSASAPAVKALPSSTVRPEAIELAGRRATVKGVDAEIVTVNGVAAYRFEADEDKPSKVNCLNDCLITWPPVLTDGSPVQASGIDRALIGSVKRQDGFEQVTLNGWPLYRFLEDTKPGDIKGEGVGGNWSLVKLDGKPVIKKPVVVD